MPTTPFETVDGGRELTSHGLASVTFKVRWSDQRAAHENELHVERFSVWREADILPEDIGTRIPGMRTGDEAHTDLYAGDQLEAWNAAKVFTAAPSKFDRHHRRGLVVEARLGRFYPQGFFHGVPGINLDSLLPARITELTPDQMILDTNHPLASFALQVSLRLDQVLPGHDMRGGRCASPLDELLQYPGLATPLAGTRATDYGEEDQGMARMDQRKDSSFYTNPRMVQHLDARALKSLEALYQRLVPAGASVLDLMASYDSHLRACTSPDLHLLGMNAAELAANPVARSRVVQDLNETPTLPYEDASLDAVVCTASVEYLIRPSDVLAEVLRVLRPGGVCAISFSNRWFPTKAIRIWSEMHEFERVGMVTQWLQLAGFKDLQTFSSLGWPRPEDDRHAGEVLLADPVYAVWGYKPQD